MLAFFAAAWLVLPGSPLVWTLLILLPSVWPVLAQALRALQTKYWAAQSERTGRAGKAPARALGACDPLSSLRSLAHPWRDSNHADPPAHFAQEIAAMDSGLHIRRNRQG